MTSQRVGGAESLTRHKLSNGPQRAQSNGGKCPPEYSATSEADVNSRGYVGILQSARFKA